MTRRQVPILVLPLTGAGSVADPAALSALQSLLPLTTDCFLFCPGALPRPADTRQEASRFFSLLEDALVPLGDRVVPLRLALHWSPSWPAGLNAGVAGARFGREHLAALWRNGRDLPRLHLVGHAAAARLVASAALDGGRADSLLLLLPDDPALTLTEMNPGAGRTIRLSRMLDEPPVTGRTVVLGSRTGPMGRPGPVSGFGDEAAEVDLRTALRDGLPSAPIIAVHATSVMGASAARARRGLHRPEVARLVLLTADLLPDGPQERTVGGSGRPRTWAVRCLACWQLRWPYQITGPRDYVCTRCRARRQGGAP